MPPTSHQAAALNISPQLQLPATAVTETIAILAKRGMGKSNAAVVMAEEMSDHGYQWVAIDPKGDWWGIRSSGDGKGPGLPVPVFGGRHGDVPLEPGAGALMARLVIERNLTCVLDVALFSKTEQIHFVTDFAETLFRAIGDDPRPLHIFLEEAEEFLPQNVKAATARMEGAYSKIAKQGRNFGLGITLITQRSASINKNALSQTDTLVLFRTVSPHDRKAVVAWAEHHTESLEIASTLAELDPGESWVLSPGFLGRIVRIRWRRRRTFDSGATPEVGASARRAPVTLADIDLDEITARMAETIEKADATNPTKLRARIRNLEKQAAAAQAAAQAAPPPADPVVEFIEIPTLDEGLVARFETVLDELRKLGTEFVDAAVGLTDNLGTARILVEHAKAKSVPTDTPPTAATTRKPTARPINRVAPTATSQVDAGDIVLKAGARKILDTIARMHPVRVSRAQVGTLAGFKISGGTFQTYWSVLRRAGYIVDEGGLVAITDTGLATAGVEPDNPMTTDEVLHLWRSRLKAGARKLLDLLVDAYPEGLTRTELGDAAEMATTGGTFQTYLSTLRRNGLAIVDGDTVTADPALMGDI